MIERGNERLDRGGAEHLTNYPGGRTRALERPATPSRCTSLSARTIVARPCSRSKTVAQLRLPRRR